MRLEPLDPVRHGNDLFEASIGADATWHYLPYGPFAGKKEFVTWLRERAPLDDPLAFTIIDREARAARGIATLMSIEPDHGSIEIGTSGDRDDDTVGWSRTARRLPRPATIRSA